MEKCYKELLNEEWVYIPIENNKEVFINNFDDGNDFYRQYPNNWKIFGKWRGKIALFNKTNPEIIINSISDWKTEIFINKKEINHDESN